MFIGGGGRCVNRHVPTPLPLAPILAMLGQTYHQGQCFCEPKTLSFLLTVASHHVRVILIAFPHLHHTDGMELARPHWTVGGI